MSMLIGRDYLRLRLCRKEDANKKSPAEYPARLVIHAR